MNGLRMHVTASKSPLSSDSLVCTDVGQANEQDVRTEKSTKQRLMIVGAGMAAFGLCDRMVRNGSIRSYEITLFGEETLPAYDRVNLSRHFSGADGEQLLLAPHHWYGEHGIELVTGKRITQIDRENQVICDRVGEFYRYDKLILATGSSPWVPPIEGANNQGVFVYRTLDDLQRIKEYIESRNAKLGAVIGGGLLGLEAAQVMSDFGLEVTVIEMAPGLMPRQLDAKAAVRLKESVEQQGVHVALVRRTQAIVADGERLVIQFGNADDLTVDVVIVAAGVRPNDSLARESGLKVGERGGIAVDDQLTTSDPNIHAIGECVSFRNHVYGLVAPCYRMADVLASRLSGQQASFEGADESAELKLMGVQVVTLGRSIGESPGGIPLTNESDSGYRKLLLERGRIVGAACVGEWNELPQIRQAVNKQERLWPWNRQRFTSSGSPWAPSGIWPIADWPSDSIVCSCLGVSHGQITTLVRSGCSDPEIIASRTGASTACGSCRSLVCELASGTKETTKVPGATSLLVASVLAGLGAVGIVTTSPIALADSVQSGWRSIDVLWRTDLMRQISGFSLLAIILMAMLFSLRKRIGEFSWGDYGIWRAAHGVLGGATAIGFLVHTGGRLGSNLNFALAMFFLATVFAGAIAGVFASLESRTQGRLAMKVRAWRPKLTKWHLWITWPLPVLIILHIVSFYWFSE